MNNTVVNILGAMYKIEFKNIADDPLLKNANGYTDPTVRKIVISNKEPDCDVKDFSCLQRKVMRHEIIHAYFEESGLSANVENLDQGVPEMHVDWFAIQAPKIYQTYVELGILDAPMDVPAAVFGDYIDRAGTTALARGLTGNIEPKELVNEMHVEAEDILDEFKAGHKADETYYGKNEKPKGVPIELADVVICCFVMADLYHIDLVSALNEKMNYNTKRVMQEAKGIIEQRQ